MQAVLLSTITALLVVLIIVALMLRSSIVDARESLTKDTAAIAMQTDALKAFLAQPVQCNFTQTAALEAALVEEPVKTKGKRK